MEIVGYVNLIEGRIASKLGTAWGADVSEGNLITFRDPLPGSPEKPRHSTADFPEVTIRFKGMPVTPVIDRASMTFGTLDDEEGCGALHKLRLDWEIKVKTRDAQTKELDVVMLKAYEVFVLAGPTLNGTPGVSMVYYGCTSRLIDDTGGTAEVADQSGTERFELTISVGIDCELQTSEIKTFNPDAPANPPE